MGLPCVHLAHLPPLSSADDMPGHVKSSIVGASLAVPVAGAKAVMPAGLGVYLCEHRNSGGWGGGHSRKIVVSVSEAFETKTLPLSVFFEKVEQGKEEKLVVILSAEVITQHLPRLACTKLGMLHVWVADAEKLSTFARAKN